ncbi:hypothetical protein AAG906_015932 [Vitis piasezkii]
MEITELCKINVPTRDYGPIRKVAFLRTSGLASTAGRFPLLVVRCAPSEVFWLLSLGCLAFRYCVRMKKTEVEDGRVQVLREDEEEWSRRQRG